MVESRPSVGERCRPIDHPRDRRIVKASPRRDKVWRLGMQLSGMMLLHFGFPSDYKTVYTQLMAR